MPILFAAVEIRSIPAGERDPTSTPRTSPSPGRTAMAGDVTATVMRCGLVSNSTCARLSSTLIASLLRYFQASSLQRSFSASWRQSKARLTDAQDIAPRADIAYKSRSPALIVLLPSVDSVPRVSRDHCDAEEKCGVANATGLLSNAGRAADHQLLRLLVRHCQ